MWLVGRGENAGSLCLLIVGSALHGCILVVFRDNSTYSGMRVCWKSASHHVTTAHLKTSNLFLILHSQCGVTPDTSRSLPNLLIKHALLLSHACRWSPFGTNLTSLEASEVTLIFNIRGSKEGVVMILVLISPDETVDLARETSRGDQSGQGPKLHEICFENQTLGLSLTTRPDLVNSWYSSAIPHSLSQFVSNQISRQPLHTILHLHCVVHWSVT